jgi:hypothetical protein
LLRTAVASPSRHVPERMKQRFAMSWQVGRSLAPARAAPGLQKGDRTASGSDPQWLRPTIFRRPFGPLHREAK